MTKDSLRAIERSKVGEWAAACVKIDRDGVTELIKLRENMKLSQAAFADAIGVSRGHLCDVERGARAVHPIMRRIGRLLTPPRL